jgi:hypothetical protein
MQTSPAERDFAPAIIYVRCPGECRGTELDFPFEVEDTKGQAECTGCGRKFSIRRHRVTERIEL